MVRSSCRVEGRLVVRPSLDDNAERRGRPGVCDQVQGADRVPLSPLEWCTRRCVSPPWSGAWRRNAQASRYRGRGAEEAGWRRSARRHACAPAAAPRPAVGPVRYWRGAGIDRGRCLGVAGGGAARWPERTSGPAGVFARSRFLPPRGRGPGSRRAPAGCGCTTARWRSSTVGGRRRRRTGAGTASRATAAPPPAAPPPCASAARSSAAPAPPTAPTASTVAADRPQLDPPPPRGDGGEQPLGLGVLGHVGRGPAQLRQRPGELALARVVRAVVTAASATLARTSLSNCIALVHQGPQRARPRGHPRRAQYSASPRPAPRPPGNVPRAPGAGSGSRCRRRPADVTG